jgi:hypothetical protein
MKGPRRRNQGAPRQIRATFPRDRALFLKEQALELVNRLGELDPETSECDEFHHLDVWADQGKVLSVVWLPDQSAEIVSIQARSLGGVLRRMTNGYKAEFIGQDVTKESL